jgi:hypothetical protein
MISSFTFRGLLPPEEAAVVLQALRAAMNDLEHPHDEHDHDRDETASAEARAQRMRERDSEDGVRWDEAMPPPPRKCDAGSLAGALVEICAEYLASRAAHADNPDTYQVIIHAGAGAITTPEERQIPESEGPGPQADGASAETSSAKALAALKEPIPLLTFPVSHPAPPERCHIEDGPAISPRRCR